MAGQVKITVVHKGFIGMNGSSGGPRPKVQAKSKPATTPMKARQESSFSDSVAGTMLVNAAKREGTELMDFGLYMWQRSMNLSDDYIGLRNLNVARNVISRGMGIGTAMISAGAMFGPVGVAVAAVTSAVTLGLDIYKNYSEQQITLQKLDAQLQFNRVRAGYSLDSGSIGGER